MPVFLQTHPTIYRSIFNSQMEECNLMQSLIPLALKYIVFTKDIWNFPIHWPIYSDASLQLSVRLGFPWYLRNHLAPSGYQHHSTLQKVKGSSELFGSSSPINRWSPKVLIYPMDGIDMYWFHIDSISIPHSFTFIHIDSIIPLKHRFHPTSPSTWPSTARPSAAAPDPQSCPETNCHGEKRWETPGSATKLIPRRSQGSWGSSSRLLLDVPNVLLGLPKVFSAMFLRVCNDVSPFLGVWMLLQCFLDTPS